MSTSGLAVADEDFNITTGSATVFALTSPADDEPTVEAFFEGAHPVYEGAQEEYSSQSIILREKQGSTAATQKGAFVASAWKIQNGTENAANSAANLKTNLELLGLQNLHRPMEITADTGTSFTSRQLTFTSGTNSLQITTDALTGSSAGAHLENIRAKLAAASDLKGFSFTFLDANDNVLASTSGANWRDTSSAVGAAAAGTMTKLIVSRDDNADFKLAANAATSLNASVDGGSTTADVNTADITTTVLAKSAVDWVDEKNPPVKVGYDAVNQRLQFEVDRTVLGSGTDSNFSSFSVYGSASQTGINNLGLTNADNAGRVAIRGGEVLYGDSFVATGEEIQPNDKRRHPGGLQFGASELLDLEWHYR